MTSSWYDLWYRPKRNPVFVHGIPAIQNSLNLANRKLGQVAEFEVTAFGSKGQAWEYNKDSIAVLVTGSNRELLRQLNELAVTKKDLKSYKRTDELVFVVPREHEKSVKRLIKVPKTLGAQVRYARAGKTKNRAV